MRLAEALRVAFDALRSNRLQTALSMLGMVIGVSAVVLLVAIGGGARDAVEHRVQALGSNLLMILPGELQLGAAPGQSHLTLADLDDVAKIVGERDRVAGAIQSGEIVRAGNASEFTTLVGATDNFAQVFSRQLQRGSFLSRSDIESRRHVVVLGSSTATKLFGETDPIGQPVTIAGVRFRVIGVFVKQGASLGIDSDLDAQIPITVAQRLLKVQRVDTVAINAPDGDAIGALGETIVAELEGNHKDTKVSAVTQEQLLGVAGQILALMTGVLAAIAGISLVVGGVGVSNIMLVSVRDRTKEIGLRKALGARQRDILAQFLFEAVMLTGFGGFVGIVLGIGQALVIANFTPLPAAITWWSPVLAFGVSAVVGILSGVMPARGAGKLDPVVALRTE